MYALYSSDLVVMYALFLQDPKCSSWSSHCSNLVSDLTGWLVAAIWFTVRLIVQEMIDNAPD